MTKPCICLLEKMREGLQLQREQFEVIDYKECFYFYSCNQEESLQNHQVGLFDGTKEEIAYLSLKKDQRTKPVAVDIKELPLGSLPGENRDQEFLAMAGKALAKNLVCAVYFVGDIFDGGWMQESLLRALEGRVAL